MVEKILSLLEEKDLNYDKLQKELQIDNELLNKALEHMINKGIIIATNKKNYRLVSKTSLKKGIVHIKKDNQMIVRLENKEEVIIPVYYVTNAMDKDIVLVDVENNRGKIIRVIEKYNPNIACEVVMKNDKCYAKYNNELIELYGNNLDNITSGYMVLIKRDNDFKKARVLELIGHKDKIDMTIIPYAYEYGFSDKFSNEVLKELENIPTFLTEEQIKKEIKENDFVDLRNEMIFTIDGADTKDIDDAISLKKLDNNLYLLGVHIAVPAYYIKRGSYIYEDVIERATSTYPNGKVIPMNHPKLSNEICSLNEDSNRFAISYFMTIDENGKCKKVDIKLSIINSKMKMTYENVNKVLEENIIPEGYEKYVSILKDMNELSRILRTRMQNDGFLEFYSPETKTIRDDNDNTYFEKRNSKTAEKLIENFMLTTNEEVTSHLTRKGLKLMYRTHEDPNQEKLCLAMSFLATKYKISLKEKYTREDIKRVLKQLKETKEEKIYNNLLIRCMSRAKFSHENVGHYATAKKIYAMQTSPIRRGEDFVDQHIILDYLKYGVEYTNELWEDELEQLAIHFTKREKAADDLENRILKNEKAKYLRNFIGQTFTGLISSVTEFGFYVEIDDMYEGLVNISSLGKKFKYIPEIFSIINKENGVIYSLGDEVEIKIKKVTDDYQVDFELVGVSNEKKEEKGKVKKKVM